MKLLKIFALWLLLGAALPVFAQNIDGRTFGMKCDNSTNDYTAFTKAIAASGPGRKAVIIPATGAPCKINSPVSVAGSLILAGENSQGAQLDFSSIGANVAITVTGTDTDGTVIRDVLINGGALLTGGIKLIDSHQFSIRNVKIQTIGAGAAIRAEGSFSGSISDVQVSNGFRAIELEYAGGDGTNGVTLDKVWATGLTSHGVVIDGSYMTTLNGVEMSGAGVMLKIVNVDASERAFGVVVNGGLYSTSGATAIQIGDGINATVKGVAIHGATITHAGGGTNAVQVYNGSGFVFGGNYFSNYTNAYRFESAVDGVCVFGGGVATGITNFVNDNGTLYTDTAAGFCRYLNVFAPNLKGKSGVIDRDKTAAVKLNRILVGSVALADNTATGLLTLTLSAVGGEDDSATADIDYNIVSGGGGTNSVTRGRCSYAFTQDNGGNRILSAPTQYGQTQALDAGMATVIVTCTATNATNVATLKITADDSANAGSTIFFEAKVMGGTRATTAAALAGGVTAGN